MLAANAQLDVGPCGSAALNGDADQLPDALLVQAHEGVLFEDALGLVLWQEVSCVVAAQAVRRLCQVVRAKTEELGLLCERTGLQAGPGQLDHRADSVVKLHPTLLLHILGSALDDFLEHLQLLHRGDQGYHDLGDGRTTVLGAPTRLGSSLEDSARLHFADLRVGHRQAAAAMTEHRVGLLELCGPAPHPLQGYLCGLRHRRHLRLRVGDELMQGRVQQAHRHGQAVHDGEELQHVRALHDQKLVQGRATAGFVQGQDHLTHRHDAVALEEHVLGAHEPDAFRAEISGGPGIRCSFGVRTNLHAPKRIRPLHDCAEVAAHPRGHRGNLAKNHLPGSPIDREHVSCSHHNVSDVHDLRGIVHPQGACSRDTGPSHAACHHGSMASHTTTRGQDPLGSVHPTDVLRAGLDAHQQHALPIQTEALGLAGVENHFAAGGTRRGGQPLGHNALRSLGVQSRMQHLVQALRLQAHDGLRMRDETLIGQVHGDLEGSLCGALARPRLQHVQLACLDSELNVLHVLEMLLEPPPHVQELLVDRWHGFFEGRELRVVDLTGGYSEVLRRADASDDVLTLRVQQELAIELVDPVRRIPREGHPCGTIVAHVAKDHGLHAHCSAPTGRDVIQAPVRLRTLVHP
mmetsp:Transcript_34408/g.111967  ORF Transcript_34408/g.111967 Transcript_34408/m.111967 type:complete len:633 (-) Transcript_34408:787-2685(-)